MLHMPLSALHLLTLQQTILTVICMSCYVRVKVAGQGDTPRAGCSLAFAVGLTVGCLGAVQPMLVKSMAAITQTKAFSSYKALVLATPSYMIHLQLYCVCISSTPCVPYTTPAAHTACMTPTAHTAYAVQYTAS